MRVLVLTRYGPLGSASRLRFYQYLSLLRRSGHEFEIQAFFTDDYVRRLYAGERQPAGDLLRAYRDRFAALRLASRYDLLWVEKEFLPWLPAFAPALLKTPYAVDFDDAHFHRYDRHRSSLVRLLLGKKVDAVMRRAAVVVAGNEYLADRARRAGAGEVVIIPTVVDTLRYPPAAGDGDLAAFRIGWIGAPVTAGYLRSIEPALRRVLRDGASLTVIGAESPFGADFPVDARPWTEKTEAAELGRLDAGIMPLPDEPFERGKCGYKLIQYMAAGLPVVASPVGVNAQIVEPGINGFLAETDDEWVAALETLRRDPALRRRLGSAGRAKVHAEYDLEVTAPMLLAALESAAGQVR
ncbi:MAG TPA: glycosyltransferase family 4 protein [Anaerolineales bacterium]|nr:glycosyltransferase family 4 protein [Anaerolineales bacterium]